MTKRETIETRVVRIAKASQRELTIDYLREYGGWLLAEGTDYGGTSTSLFGSRRRSYGDFIDWLDGILLGLQIGETK